MKLIEVIGKVILERASDEETTPNREPNNNERISGTDREEPRRGSSDREEPRRDSDGEERERVDREEPRTDRERERRTREERERRAREERERKAREERERRTRERPKVINRNTKEPPTTDGEEIKRVINDPKTQPKNIEKQKDNSNLLKKPEFDTLKDIKNIKKIQTEKFLNRVEDKIEIQLKQQPAKVTQTLKKYNVDSKVMAKLAPLTKESFKTVMSLEGNGVKLPLLILLFKNKNKLYNSMKTGKPLTKKDVRPAGGGINYNQFWKWSSKLENGWGRWLGDNVVKNFPEMSSLTLSF